MLTVISYKLTVRKKIKLTYELVLYVIHCNNVHHPCNTFSVTETKRDK